MYFNVHCINLQFTVYMSLCLYDFESKIFFVHQYCFTQMRIWHQKRFLKHKKCVFDAEIKNDIFYVIVAVI